MNASSTPGLSELATRLQQIIDSFTTQLYQLDEHEFFYRHNPEKWSRNEVLGHLIDSAQNNLRRFISTQYEITPPHIIYNQDFWVAANDYQHVSPRDLVLLWKLLNERIVRVLDSMPPSAAERLCNTGKEKEEFHTIRFLADDYISHLLHHMKQIIPI